MLAVYGWAAREKTVIALAIFLFRLVCCCSLSLPADCLASATSSQQLGLYALAMFVMIAYHESYIISTTKSTQPPDA